MKSVKVDIVNRRKSDGKVVRELICGHEQVQPRGGKAHLATSALCVQCSDKSKQPVVSEAPTGA